MIGAVRVDSSAAGFFVQNPFISTIFRDALILSFSVPVSRIFDPCP